MPDARQLGPIVKGQGASLGIGLQNEDKEGIRNDHVLVAYVTDECPLKGKIFQGDEILEVNGAKFESAKKCSEFIVAATELSLKVINPAEQIQIVGLRKK